MFEVLGADGLDVTASLCIWCLSFVVLQL